MDTDFELNKETLSDPFDPDEFNEYLNQSCETLKAIIKCYKYDKFVGSLILQNYYIFTTLLARGQYRLLFDYLSITKALDVRSEDMEIERLKAERDEIEEKHQMFERMDAIRYMDELSLCLEDYRDKCANDEKEGDKKMSDKKTHGSIRGTGTHDTGTRSKGTRGRGIRSRGTRGRGTRSRGTRGRGTRGKTSTKTNEITSSYDPMADLDGSDDEI